MMRILSAEYITCISMPMKQSQAEDLADYVRRVVKEERLSYRDVEARAKKKGLNITNGYISRIISRSVDNPSVNKLKALAVGLNRPEEEVFAIVRGQNTEEAKIQDAFMNALAYDYQQLSKKDKDAIAPLLRALKTEIDERLGNK